MRQEDFKDKFHWLCGISEYYRFTGQPGDFEELYTAIFHNFPWTRRDIIIKLLDGEYGDLSHIPADVRHSWINVLMHQELDIPEEDLKIEIITGMIQSLAKDNFTSRISNFINYFLFDSDDSIMLPNMNDFLSRGQVKSKLWMIAELANVVDGSLGKIAFYGGWYNFAAGFLFDQFEVEKIYSIDLDDSVVEPCNRLYPYETGAGKFFPITHDVNQLQWNNKSLSGVGDVNMVVNTSCEHMNDEWFNTIPDGMFVVLQTNDYFDNDQHVNCCKDLEEVKLKYPMSNLFYAGELDTQLYNRFMLIGIK